MNDLWGLSIGTSNFVAAPEGGPAVTRRSVLTLFDHGAAVLGAPGSDGQVISGFVERMGVSGPLVASDGSAHDAATLLVQAIDAMIGAAGADAAAMKLAIAVPAYWDSASRAALRDALNTHGGLSTLSGPPRLVSDARAALQQHAGLPDEGVVVLIDIGGSGTSITLADAGKGFQPIDETRRYKVFSGDRMDDALLAHVLDGLGHAEQSGHAAQSGGVQTGATAAVTQLAELRNECTRAKELLSQQTTADLVADLRGSHLGVRVTRSEFEALIAEPLRGMMAVLDDMLEGNMIRSSQLAAVALAGGGASIPLIAERLSARHRVPVLTSEHPAFDVALGAASLVQCMSEEDATTRTAVALEESQARTSLAVAVGAGAMPGYSSVDGPGLAEPELAWSQEEIRFGDEPVAYDGDAYTSIDLKPATPYQVPSRLPDRRVRAVQPRLILGLGALAAMVAIGGVGYRLVSSTDTEAPVETPVTSNLAPPAAPSSQIAVVPPPSVAPAEVPNAVSSPEPPPPPPAPPSPAPVMTTQAPPVQATTTTTPSPTPSAVTTTPPPVTTTSAPPAATSSQPPTTTSQVPMTTGYLTLPFVPVPIPVQVPQAQAPAAPAAPVAPQNPFINSPGGVGFYP